MYLLTAYIWHPTYTWGISRCWSRSKRLLLVTGDCVLDWTNQISVSFHSSSSPSTSLSNLSRDTRDSKDLRLTLHGPQPLKSFFKFFSSINFGHKELPLPSHTFPTTFNINRSTFNNMSSYCRAVHPSSISSLHFQMLQSSQWIYSILAVAAKLPY